MSTPTLDRPTPQQDQDHGQERASWTTRAAGWWTRQMTTLRERQARRFATRVLMGNRVDELPANARERVDYDAAAHANALRAARPTAVATIVAALVFGLSALVTAPVAAAIDPLAHLEALVGHQLTSSDPMTAWLLRHGHSPVVSLVLWLVAYASLAGDVRRVVTGAHRGYSAVAARISLAMTVLVLAAAIFWHLDRTAGLPAAFVGVALVLTAWRALTRATAIECRAVLALNQRYANHHLAARERY